MILQFLLALGVGLAAAQKTTSSSQWTTESPHWTDPFVNGRFGNPGARISISNKTFDQVHKFAANGIAETFKNMTISDYQVSVGSGLLTIKPPKVTEFKFDGIHAMYSSPALVHSHFHDGRLVANGVWTYREVYGRNFGPLNGTFRLQVTDAELNTTTKLSKNQDGKPWAELTNCAPWFGKFRVAIQGAPNITFVENAVDPVSTKIHTWVKESVCTAVRLFLKQSINAALATFPNLMTISDSKQHKIQVDYDVINNEQLKFVDGFLQAGFEGKTKWRGNDYTPFSPSDLQFSTTNRMLAFELSDYTFNTLLHQAQSQGFRFSAFQLLEESTKIKDQLRLDCSQSGSPNPHLRKTKPKQNPKAKGRALESETTVYDVKCLGAVFQNATTSIGQFASNQTGDIVFKGNQKAPSILILSDSQGFFDASNAILEIYGPADRFLFAGRSENEQRSLLAKAEVDVLRGQFTPMLVNGNITGVIKISEFKLKQGSIGSAAQTRRSLDSDWMMKLEHFSKPMIVDMFNVFFKKYAQFSIPLLDGFECMSPSFKVSARTMQVDCDLKLKIV